MRTKGNLAQTPARSLFFFFNWHLVFQCSQYRLKGEARTNSLGAGLGGLDTLRV